MAKKEPRGGRGRPPSPRGPRPARSIRFDAEELDAFTKAAADAKLDLSEWVRRQCRIAVGMPPA